MEEEWFIVSNPKFRRECLNFNSIVTIIIIADLNATPAIISMDRCDTSVHHTH